MKPENALQVRKISEQDINNVDYNAAFVNNQAITNLSSLISGNYTYYFC